jgi:hypothetical protein
MRTEAATLKPPEPCPTRLRRVPRHAGGIELVDSDGELGSLDCVHHELATASPRIQSRYRHRVLFIVGLGVLLALLGDVARIGIRGSPVRTGLLLAANRVAQWTLVDVVMAWAVRRSLTSVSSGEASSCPSA